jgi:uncharacterized protein
MIMIIRNITNGKVIATSVEIAKTMPQKARGLMGRKELSEDYAMLFDLGSERKEGFWMMFMRTPIDIVFVDSKKAVVDIKHSVRPISFNPMTWRLFYPKRPASYVIETKAGLMEKLNVKINDKLEFIEEHAKAIKQ